MPSSARLNSAKNRGIFADLTSNWGGEMRMITKTLLTAIALLTTSVSMAGSLEMESFQCGKNAIEVGMTVDEVKTVCASYVPSYISKHARPALRAAKDGSTPDDLFEKWMYKTAGSNDTHVLIKNGVVVRIFTNQ
jgi:hypothetical protein